MQTFAAAINPAEGTVGRMQALFTGDQRAHAQADQLGGGHADELGHAAIDAQNTPGLVVHHDEVADGIEDLNPLRVRLCHAAEKAGVVQGDGGIFGDRLQQFAIGPQQFAAIVGDQQQADQFIVDSLEPNCRQILPAETDGERSSDKVAGRSAANRLPAEMGKVGEREIQPSQGAVALRNGTLMQVNSFQVLPARQRQGGSGTAKHLAGAACN